ncbi:uncharacterized protein LOC128214080 [Mya arenaria]|uniref:uncharacterized protein LOC128214080 n=1 Tax=Mya arenaria TaxID=6604 RepID=UPI0022E51B66|nr:uncharacterized protein LOC128214080 [Mya arenaria]
MKIILFALQLAYARAGQMCYDCSRMPSPSDCSHTILCNEHETCHTTQIVTDNGHIVYDSGCMSNPRCPGAGSVKMSPLHDVIISPRIPGDIVTCIECCRGEFCNNQGCGAKPLLDRPSRGPICVTCDVSVSPDACEFVSVCTQDEECFLSSDYNPLTGDKRYTSKCGSKQTCEALRRNYADVIGRRAAPDCLGCCDDDYCNNNCSNVLMVGTGDSHTSRKPTTTIISPRKQHLLRPHQHHKPQKVRVNRAEGINTLVNGATVCAYIRTKNSIGTQPEQAAGRRRAT